MVVCCVRVRYIHADSRTNVSVTLSNSLKSLGEQAIYYLRFTCFFFLVSFGFFLSISSVLVFSYFVLALSFLAGLALLCVFLCWWVFACTNVTMIYFS